MATLDIALQSLLARQQHIASGAAHGIEPLADDKALFISVRVRPGVDPRSLPGFDAGSVLGPIAFGRTTLPGLQGLAEHPQVVSIEKQRRASTHLDSSVPGIRANRVWKFDDNQFGAYTGHGVIVGIIDTGIDFRHEAFRKLFGLTRVTRIWDQTLTAVEGEVIPGPLTEPSISLGGTALGYGVEYTEDDINNVLNGVDGATAERHVDRNGHGTHVAGIAAGSGSKAGHCHGPFHYIGVAPEAELMIVRMWGLTRGDAKTPPTNDSVLVNAIQYLLDRARLAGKPLVINASLGTGSEKMDGTSDICSVIDSLMRANSMARSLVFSAGNQADRGFHAIGTVPGGNGAMLKMPFVIVKDDKIARSFVVQPPGLPLQARLTSAQATTAWGPPVVDQHVNGSNSAVTITRMDGHIGFEIRPPEGGSNLAGDWTLELRNTGPAEVKVDVYYNGGNVKEKAPRFTSGTTPRSTLSDYATAYEVISVGSVDDTGKHLAESSGRGPTLENPERELHKPEIVAPGIDIASTAASGERLCITACCCDCYRDFYVDKSGTSMAAPHVAGTVALMLHRNPHLTHTQIRKLLVDNTEPVPETVSVDDRPGWGKGFLNAEKAVYAAEMVNPGRPLPGPPFEPIAAPHPLQASLLATPRGPTLRGLVEKHATEVWTLIQKNRRVATAWHRCQGPRWVRLVMTALNTADTDRPLQVDGVDLRACLHRLAAAFKRYGSGALQHDVAQWESEFARISDGMSLQALVDVLGRPASPSLDECTP